MAMFLFDVQEKNRLKQRGLLKRFSLKCIGKQSTLEQIRSDKAEKYKELKDKKDTPEYDEWFLKYNPNMKRRYVRKMNNIKRRTEFLFSPQAKHEAKPKSDMKLNRKPKYNTNKNKKGNRRYNKKKTIKTFLF
jgi:hypothetical protein